MKFLSDNILIHLRSVTNLPELSETKYKCVQKIASGGMGTVYLAEDTQLQRNVALKILDIPDADGIMATRLMQEAHIIAALEHPSIIPIHDVGTLPDGRVFYTMKFVKGCRLDQQVHQSCSVTELLRIFQKVCEAVAFAHARKVIHRDLKPENIMVGDFGEVLVMDWGLAKILSPNRDILEEKTEQYFPDSDRSPGSISSNLKTLSPTSENLTEYGTVMGTPEYMAPEQERGDIAQIDYSADIYSLGAILNFLLSVKYSGQFDRTKSTKYFTLHQLIIFSKITLNRIPRQLRAIAEKSMSYEKNDRYSNALDVTNDI